MGLLTETELRLKLRDSDLETMNEYRVEPGTIVTPSARMFLAEHKIALAFGKEQEPQEASLLEGNGNLPAFKPPKRYASLDGGYYDEKPEHMTALHGMVLVNKDHPRILLRGKVDSLEGKLAEVQICVQKLGMKTLWEDLAEIVSFLKELMRCEVLEEPLLEKKLLGMDGAEIRARSHTPKKYYGLPHFAPSAEHGEAVVLLNALRTQTRETELAAYRAFRDDRGVPVRLDLIQAFNRLSSLFYVMMFRVLVKEYEK